MRLRLPEIRVPFVSDAIVDGVRTYYAEASDISPLSAGAFMSKLGRVYDDAIDVGFVMLDETRAGERTEWLFCDAKRTPDGESVEAYNFVQLGGDARLVIFND